MALASSTLAETEKLAVGLTRATLEHQLRVQGSDRPVSSYPAAIGEHIGWWHPKAHETRDLVDEAITAAKQPASAVWVILPLAGAKPAWPRGTNILMQGFRRAGWQLGPPQRVGDFGVIRFSRTAN